MPKTLMLMCDRLQRPLFDCGLAEVEPRLAKSGLASPAMARNKERGHAQKKKNETNPNRGLSFVRDRMRLIRPLKKSHGSARALAWDKKEKNRARGVYRRKSMMRDSGSMLRCRGGGGEGAWTRARRAAMYRSFRNKNQATSALYRYSDVEHAVGVPVEGVV